MQGEKQSFWKSRTVRSALALIFGAISYLAASFGFVDWQDLGAAETVYPDIQNGIAMIKAGQWLAGLTLIGSSLAIYFRVKATKLIGF